jgi:hypothetical protein
VPRLTIVPRIEPSADLYGGKARRSALADHLELISLSGGQPRVDQLADYIGDAGWTQKLDELYVDHSTAAASDPDGDPEELPTDTTLAAESVFDLLRERARVLGDRYPFDVTDIGVGQRGDEVSHGPYLALLAISTAHAHSLVVPGEMPWEMFQALVARCLCDAGIPAVDFAGARRGVTFDDALIDAAGRVGLQATPNVGIRSRRAHDENVDAIAHLDRRDGRPGQWVFIGQVTCEKSDGWEGKIQEPAEAYWCDMLGISIPPQVFLAVPYHAEARHLSKLVQDRGKAILDRLNFTLWMSEVSDPEMAVINLVLSEEIEAL